MFHRVCIICILFSMILSEDYILDEWYIVPMDEDITLLTCLRKFT